MSLHSVKSVYGVTYFFLLLSNFTQYIMQARKSGPKNKMSLSGVEQHNLSVNASLSFYVKSLLLYNLLDSGGNHLD